jgi:hypothetical protein
LLRRDLTEQNADLETHRRRGYVANLCVDVLRSKRRGRRGVTLEDPERVSLKKICRSYARICARYPRWPGFPDETRKTIYWYHKRSGTLGAGFFLRAASVDLLKELEDRIVCGDRAMETLPLDRTGRRPARDHGCLNERKCLT